MKITDEILLGMGFVLGRDFPFLTYYLDGSHGSVWVRMEGEPLRNSVSEGCVWAFAPETPLNELIRLMCEQSYESGYESARCHYDENYD